ncbi:hypothetical protein Tco_1437055 [Tanacetum coccineum]
MGRLGGQGMELSGGGSIGRSGGESIGRLRREDEYGMESSEIEANKGGYVSEVLEVKTMNLDGVWKEQQLRLCGEFVKTTSSFLSEIFKSLSFRLDRLCHLAILCLDQHAHTLHHLESLLTISLDRLDIFDGRSCISEFVRKSVGFQLKRRSYYTDCIRFSMLDILNAERLNADNPFDTRLDYIGILKSIPQCCLMMTMDGFHSSL